MVGSASEIVPLAQKPTGTDVVFAPRVTPNPMFRHGALEFATARPGALRVALYDVAGREVRVLADEPFAPAGSRHLEIDRRDAKGMPLEAGVYFYRIESSAGRATGRVVFMK